MNNYDDLLSNTPAEVQGSQMSKEEYATKKQAERDGLYALSDQTALEVAGDSGKFKQYLDLQGKLDRYSAVNALLILAQKPEATRLGDFDHWKERGGFVKRDQTGIAILEPHEYSKEDGTPGTGYNVKKVFDVSQVDTQRMKMPPPASYDDRQLLRALIHKAPMRITGVDELPGNLGAMTDPDTGDISVRKGMAFGDTFRSVAMEFSAAVLAGSPNTQADPHFSAYCATYLLCVKYGVDTQGFPFADAPRVFGALDAQGIKGELQQVRDAAGDISGRMAKQLDAVQKAAKAQEPR